MMVNKTKLNKTKLKIVHKKKSNSIKGCLITYGLRTSSDTYLILTQSDVRESKLLENC
jgi:hypothetical protein